MFVYLENRAVYEIMLNNTAELGRPQVTIWSMRIACWLLKAKHTHHTHTPHTPHTTHHTHHTHTHTHTPHIHTHTHNTHTPHIYTHTHKTHTHHTYTHTHTHHTHHTYTHTHTICNAYCFSTATMDTRTRLSVAFIRALQILLQRRNSNVLKRISVYSGKCLELFDIF